MNPSNAVAAALFLIAGSIPQATLLGMALAEAQGPGQDEYFGRDGKLFSVERSGSDRIKRYLLNRRPISGEDGFYYDGKIRTRTDIDGGGYTIDETAFFLECSSAAEEVSVRFGSEIDRGSGTRIQKGRQKPGRSELNAYNLWWAACKDEFRKFK